MNQQPITVLLIEDNPRDAQILAAALAKERDSPFVLTRADRLSNGLQRLAKGGVDLVLLDLMLPDSKGLSTLVTVHEHSPGIPIVVLTASDDEALVLQAAQKGAQDYLVKGYIQVYPKLLWQAMRYALERKHAEEALRQAHALTERLLASITSILIGVDTTGLVTHWNQVAEQTFGIREADARNQRLASCGIQWDSAMVLEHISRCWQMDRPIRLDDVAFARPGGEAGALGITIIPIRGAAGAPAGALLFGADITERKQAEMERARLQEQLLQAQKMESIGQFAGGIAHDFGNFLQVILGFALLIQARHRDDRELMSDLQEIVHASESASEMVRKLLAFSRHNPLKPKVFEINQAIRGMSRLVQQLVGERIHLELHVAAEPLFIKLDPTGLEQILMNLASNARDAMSQGGTLTIETAQESDVVRLCVRDTGTGMDPQAASHIFEPFFTTKQVNRGTGLGLAVVYGLVSQHNGAISIETSPGHGTAFHLRFPRQEPRPEELDAAPDAPARSQESETIQTGGGRVLVVDDEASIRAMCERILQDSYKVLTAPSGQRALELLERERYDLLLTDIRMPEMDGFALIEQAVKLRPELKVLAMSGLLTDEMEQRLRAPAFRCEVIRKPFTATALQEVVNRCVSERRASSGL